ncbi:MAG: hypothetical protein JW751_26975 [Polyangiaceae bacterium]|nr:hypothetical protein [Polyangiaceae bacterium]
MGPAPSAEAPANAPAGAPAPGTVASPPGKVPVSFVPRRGQRDGVVVKDRQTGESCELPCTLYVDPGDHTFALAHGGPLKTKRFVTVSDGGTTVSVKAGSKPIYWLGAGILWVGVGLLVADQVAGPGSMASTAIAGGVALSGAVMLLPAMPKLRDTGVTPAAGAGPRAGRPRLAVGVGANGGYVTVRAAF